MDEDQNSVEEEVTPQDQESTIVDEQPQEEVQGESESQEETPQEINFRTLRKKADDKEREALELKQELKAQKELFNNYLLQSKATPQPIQPPVVEETEQIDPSDYPNYGQTDKLIDKKAEMMFEKKFYELEKKRDSARFHERLQSKYSDFDDIVNSETIALLEQKEPELATTIADLKDPYKMGLQTYNFIKSMNLGRSSDEKRHAKEVSKKIDKNENSVQTPQAYNKRPMAQAFTISNMSNEEKQKMYDEMMGFASQTSGY